MSKKYDSSLHKLDSKGEIYVGIPRERIYIPKFVDNRDRILGVLSEQKRGRGYFQAEGHRVDRNRDRIALEFMNQESKPPWLLMLDSDMEHPDDIGIRLTAWEKPIIGGLYFHRGDTHDPFVFRKDEIEYGGDLFDRERQQWLPMRDEVYDFLQENNIPKRDGSLVIGDPAQVGLIECDAVATGAMLIHRSVFETMEPPWFEYRTGGHSEDLIFCDRAKFDHGIPIHCDMSTISGHYRWQPMGQGQFQQLYEGRGVNLTMYNIKQIAEQFAEFFDISEKSAIEDIQNGNAHMVGSYWRSKVPTTAEDVREFYQDSHTGYLYVIELIHWNMSSTFDFFKKQLISVRNKKVLEIGSGIGTIAFQLAIQNNNVVASEINDTIRGFAEHRWEFFKENIGGRLGSIKFVKDEWKGIETDSLDLVIAIDTIEHMPKEDVQEFIHEVGRVLKPNEGGFMFHNNWEQQDLYPMHFDWSKYWPEWLAEAGLVQISPLRAIKVGKPVLTEEDIKHA